MNGFALVLRSSEEQSNGFSPVLKPGRVIGPLFGRANRAAILGGFGAGERGCLLVCHCALKAPAVKSVCWLPVGAATHDKRSRPRGDYGARRSVGGCRPRAEPKHAKHNNSFLKSDLESTREFGRLQGGPFYSHSERPTVGRPRGDPRCRSTQGRLPAVDLGRALPNLR